MSIGLQIEVGEVEDKVILAIEGRLDAASSPVLEKKLNDLLEENRKKIILDFSNVEYLSSAGIRLLLAFTKKLKAQEGNLVIFSIGEDIMEIIKMAGFESILNIYATQEQALQNI